MAGIYIHIPFCKQACRYCDFHFSTNTTFLNQMILMIGKEIKHRANYLQGAPVNTIYFGGGTPSLLHPKWIDFLLREIKESFALDLEEITLEANPDDLSEENLSAWKELGIDRLSLGIQSFDEEVLRFYNRAHTAEESHQAIEKARNAGFGKFSMDLIYGFPSSNHDIWKKDLKLALAQNPGHLSCYGLTIEPKTALGNWTEKGKFTPASDEFVAEQFEIMQEFTLQAGYEQYEISNFALPGHRAIHNTSYWLGQAYLGLGPGAHSYDGKNRGANPRNNPEYIRCLQQDQVPFEIEILDEQDRLNEYLLTALRTSWGIDLLWVKEHYGVDLQMERSAVLAQMEEAGWLLWKDNTLSLSRSGKLIADSIAAALFL
ncbi:radical SAM family heme chaperone HemW [Algoriphagus hitonicola]|uniref:Heme chaperone HemW n=1 Tax=Algoriphagus hitonicola TaxID=435880 RepID=A0A1I2VYP2_9BACT|nr:radical SAM family heme chaperone HemW [Algoriphagus hitonicola]SFG94152.1 oxygen-independent coproporphyrinogen-3 oxidase [Algoriphagus hitonicola]